MTSSSNPSDLEIVVGDDGSIASIPAETLAKYGLSRPGAHLRLVEVGNGRSEPKSSRGLLKGRIDSQAITEALLANREERLAVMAADES